MVGPDKNVGLEDKGGPGNRVGRKNQAEPQNKGGPGNKVGLPIVIHIYRERETETYIHIFPIDSMYIIYCLYCLWRDDGKYSYSNAKLYANSYT